MKRILSRGITELTKYRIKCPYCDCEFEYGLDDTYIPLDITGLSKERPPVFVSCPECHRPLNHEDSAMSKMTTMVL